MSEPNLNSKEEYMRRFRQHLYASETFHQMLVMMAVRERVIQDLMRLQKATASRQPLLKRLHAHAITLLLALQKAKPKASVDFLVELDNKPPWTIDAFFVVTADGTVTDVSNEPIIKE